VLQELERQRAEKSSPVAARVAALAT
jgi:hypothetical protein